jgi:serine protease AprX
VRGVQISRPAPAAPSRVASVLSARLLAAFSALLVAAVASPVLAVAPARTAASTGLMSVIVRGEARMLDRLEHSTVLAGGTVVRELKIIDGFSAEVPTDQLAALRALPGVASLVANLPLSFRSDYSPAGDPYSMANTATAVGASAAWAAGITGAGVDVALVDSGVTPVQGLAGGGKVVNGPDVSVDSQNPSTRYLDGFGHGTFMAGLIGGRDPGADPTRPGSSYLGLAPDARIVNVKVGSGSGAVDVSQVIAGIDWVVQHRHDNGLNIRVLNLSIGTNGGQSYQLDPLAYAAEVAWASGIVVVAAAGNEGAAEGHLDNPASDPFVIAVGASGQNNLVVAAFSSIGDGTRNPDVIAPGSHLQGLRVPGSYIDQNFPSAAFGDRFFRGSGTSEATALTSGAVALLLQKRPDLKPGQVKDILMQSAAALPLVAVKAQGAGLLQLGAGVSDALSVPGGWQGFTPSAGTGSLEKARGTRHVTVGGVPLTGEEDIFGHAFSSADHATQAGAGQGWGADGSWNGTTWSGTTWSGTTWSGTTWSGTTWSGTTWSGTTWTGTTWSGTTWSGTTWSGTTWSSQIWSNYSWS